MVSGTVYHISGRLSMITMKAVIDTKGIQDTFDGIEREISFGLAREGARFMRLYMATVANWEVKPEFSLDVYQDSNEASVVVGTNNNVYRFLHDGTRQRWALMTDPFEPKTFVRILGVGPGSGGTVLRGRTAFAKAGRPTFQPGIKAREWTQEIIKREEKNFEANMQAVFDNAVQKGGAQVK
jgi:hypothetical protein